MKQRHLNTPITRISESIAYIESANRDNLNDVQQASMTVIISTLKQMMEKLEKIKKELPNDSNNWTAILETPIIGDNYVTTSNPFQEQPYQINAQPIEFNVNTPIQTIEFEDLDN